MDDPVYIRLRSMIIGEIGDIVNEYEDDAYKQLTVQAICVAVPKLGMLTDPLVFEYACSSDHLMQLTMLMANSGANVHGDTYANLEGEACQTSPIRTALSPKNGGVETVKFLCGRGVDVHAVDKRGDPLMHRASTVAMIDCLLAEGLDINAANDAGETILHRCVSRGSGKTIIQLISHAVKVGADPTRRTLAGQTPADLVRAAVPRHQLERRILAALGEAGRDG